MHSVSTQPAPSQTPPILDVIGEHVELRKRGRQHWGLCPFHSEKTRSFAVSEEKNLYYCHGCHIGGDVIDFIERIEGVDFKTAVRKLGMESYRPSPEQLEVRREAKRIASWVSATSAKICEALREIGDEIAVCKVARSKPYTDQKLLAQHEASLIRQWAILADLDDDLSQPKIAAELWRQRADIDGFVESLK